MVSTAWVPWGASMRLDSSSPFHNMVDRAARARAKFLSCLAPNSTLILMDGVAPIHRPLACLATGSRTCVSRSLTCQQYGAEQYGAGHSARRIRKPRQPCPLSADVSHHGLVIPNARGTFGDKPNRAPDFDTNVDSPPLTPL